MVIDNTLARSRIVEIREALNDETDEVLIRRLRNGEYQGDIRKLSSDSTPLTFEELTQCGIHGFFSTHTSKRAKQSFPVAEIFP